jgi:hypothetical protein
LAGQDNQVWLVNLKDHPRFVEVLSAESSGCSLEQSIAICCDALCNLLIVQQPLPDWNLHNGQLQEEHVDHFVQTRSSKFKSKHPTPKSRITHRQPSVTVDPITNWVGKQLEGQSIPQTIMDRLQSGHPNFPSDMLVLSSDDRRSPRILVPKYVQHDLVLQAHLDIHHQHYRKVHKILRPIYYWPAMDSAIENICKQCSICRIAQVRRQKLQADF